MRIQVRTFLITCLFLPVVSQAAWSGCQKVTAVTNYLAYNSSVFLTLSPGISGCSFASVTGAIGFTIGQMNVTSGNINTLLASGMTALTLGRGVMIYYDSSTANCYSEMIAIGGYDGSCP